MIKYKFFDNADSLVEFVNSGQVKVVSVACPGSTFCLFYADRDKKESENFAQKILKHINVPEEMPRI